jgi:hypothetical protein
VHHRTCLLVLLGSTTLGAQIAPGNVVVAVHQTTVPATQLLAVDIATGAFNVLPRFPADVMPPLAVTFDTVDDGLLLAVDAGGGISRVFRYDIQAGLPVNERALGDVPGHVTDLTLGAGLLLAAVDGAQGGIYGLPRTGGTAALVMSLPELSVLGGSPGNELVVAVWSAGTGTTPTNPGAGIAALPGGNYFFGPASFTNWQHPVITGATTLPFPQPRLVLSHADGTIAYEQLTYGGGGQPVVIPVQPTPPAGSANAMKSAPTLGIRPLVLGGSAFPMLWTFDPMTNASVMTTIAGPLPGDPVDFAMAPDTSGWLQSFGTACGATGMELLPQGQPSPGATLQLQLTSGTPNAAALAVFGLSDQLGGTLPFTLPGGCQLFVSPDAVLFHTTDASGAALQLLSIPNQAAFVGVTVFTQWLQVPAQFAVSDALSIRVGT